MTTTLATETPPSPMPPIADPEDLIALVKRYRSETGMSLSGMAKAAGLHFNSLNRIDDPAWRPRLDTLHKLHRWLSDVGVAELPMIGEGWEIAHDRDGWWVVSDETARGPYNSLKKAVSYAQETYGAKVVTGPETD